MIDGFFELSDAQALIRDTARNYAQRALFPVAAKLDRERIFPGEQIAALAELGLMGVNVPEEYGGAGAGGGAYAGGMMEIAQGGAPPPRTPAGEKKGPLAHLSVCSGAEKRQDVPGGTPPPVPE